MNTIVLAFFLIAASGLVAGCRTSTHSSARSERPERESAILASNSTNSQTGLAELLVAVRSVLDDHGFLPPTLIEGSGNLTWAVSPRSRSAGSVQVAVVKVSQTGEVEVRLSGYQQVGSSWAVLGRFFRGPLVQETGEIENEIAERLVHRSQRMKE